MASSKITTIDLEEPVVEALNTIDTVADQITEMNGEVDSIKTTVEDNATGISNLNTQLINITNQLANNSGSALVTEQSGITALVVSGGGDADRTVLSFTGKGILIIPGSGIYGKYTSIKVDGVETYNKSHSSYYSTVSLGNITLYFNESVSVNIEPSDANYTRGIQYQLIRYK